MPFAQLLTSVIETSVNQLLNLDEASGQRFSKLTGKQIRVHLQELPFPIRFCFSDKVFVMAEQNNEPVACDVSISVSVLSISELKDSSQLTRMIKNDELQLEGDLSTAQQFSTLFSELSIDWEELLAQKVGDVMAYQLMNVGKGLKRHVLRIHDTVQKIVKDAALEEKQIAAHPVLVEHFIEDVHDVNAKVARLEQRIEQLEK